MFENVWLEIGLLNALLPSRGGNPPLRSSASTTVYVNLLDLNDNDPTFLNLPFIAEVPEGLPVGSSVFRVGLGFLILFSSLSMQYMWQKYHIAIFTAGQKNLENVQCLVPNVCHIKHTF